MAGFLERRLSDAVSRGSTGGPVSSRVKVYTEARRLTQKFLASRLLQTYDYNFGNKTQDDFEEIRAMVYIVFGTPYTGFRWKDWNDYELGPDTSALAFVSGTNWQLYRRYALMSGEFWDRLVQKPNDDLVIQRTRSGIVSIATADVDTTTGLVDISGHVGGDIYACGDGTFDVPVTFMDNDALAKVGLDGMSEREIQELPSIKLEEILL